MERCILVTGANGLLGGKVIRKLFETTEFRIVGVAATEEKMQEMLSRERIWDRTKIDFISNEQLLCGGIDLSAVFGAVHLAFSRRIRPAEEIATSIDFARDVFARLAVSGAERIINISSQSVYGNAKEIRTEDMLPSPESAYAMAKYASEVIFCSIMRQAAVKDYTSLRLDLVVQSQNVVKSLCRQAKEGRLRLKGGKQLFSFIDADDVARAIVVMLQSTDGWEKAYNVGWNRCRYTLMDVAEAVAEVAEEEGYSRPVIELDEREDIRLWAGMDSSRFMEKTGWFPQIQFFEMIRTMMLGQGYNKGRNEDGQ